MNRHLLNISFRLLSLLVAPAILLAPAPAFCAPSNEEENYMGEPPERYAQVRMLEGSVTVRKGDGSENLDRGIPVGEGDVVESRGRGILQLGDGSRIIFGSGTRFQLATLFSDRDGDRQVLIRLDYGKLRVHVGSDSDGVIRVDTPVGTGTLQEQDAASFDLDRDETATVKVFRGRISFSNDRNRVKLDAGERLTIYGSRDSLDRVRNFNTYDGDSFDRWCDDNGSPRKSASWDRVPREIRYYADDLDDNGEWIYVDECAAYCWRPRRISNEWRPYWRGRWAAYPSGMTWVSDEPWGYVTYHYGRWGWHSRIGWYWVPGVYYSPAWVAWNVSGDYFGWAPLDTWNAPCHWGFGAWNGGFCWNIVSINQVHTTHIHNYIQSQPTVIRDFGVHIDINVSGRPRESSWYRSPLIVTRNEFGNPREMRRVMVERPVRMERLQRYEREARQSTGREILRLPSNLRPEVRPGSGRPGVFERSGGERPSRPGVERPGERPGMGFEDRSRLNRPIFRTEPRHPGDSRRPGLDLRPESRPGSRPEVHPESRPDSGIRPGSRPTPGSRPDMDRRPERPEGARPNPFDSRPPREMPARPGSGRPDSGPRPGMPDEGRRPMDRPGARPGMSIEDPELLKRRPEAPQERPGGMERPGMDRPGDRPGMGRPGAERPGGERPSRGR